MRKSISKARNTKNRKNKRKAKQQVKSLKHRVYHKIPLHFPRLTAKYLQLFKALLIINLQYLLNRTSLVDKNKNCK